MASVHQPVKQGASQQEKVRQDAQQVRSVFRPEEKGRDGYEAKKDQPASRPPPPA